MVPQGLEEAMWTCTVDCKAKGSGLLGENQKYTQKSTYRSHIQLYYSKGKRFFRQNDPKD